MLNLYISVTPEKLCSSEFMKLLEPVYLRGELNRLVVDEVRWIHTHSFCISLTILGTLYIRAWKGY